MFGEHGFSGIRMRFSVNGSQAKLHQWTVCYLVTGITDCLLLKTVYIGSLRSCSYTNTITRQKYQINLQNIQWHEI